MSSDPCEICDRATCERRSSDDCTDHRVDWRARALAAESESARLLDASASEPFADRLATIASEAFGPFPVQTVEENLSAIERGIGEHHHQVVTALYQRDQLQKLADDRLSLIRRFEQSDAELLHDVEKARAREAMATQAVADESAEVDRLRAIVDTLQSDLVEAHSARSNLTARLANAIDELAALRVTIRAATGGFGGGA